MNRLASRVLRGVREHTYLFAVSTGVITAALLLIGMFLMVSANLEQILGSWESDVHVSAYLLPGGTPDTHVQVLQGIAARPEVAEVRYVSKEDARAWIEARMPELTPVLDDLGPDALPASIEITLRSEHTNAAALATFVTSLQATGAFEELDYGQEWITRVQTFLSIANALAIALGGFIGLAALFLVGNTIHLVVYSRRDELEIMRLVGASDSYILAPFVAEGALQGMTAAGVATALLWAAHQGLLSRLEPVLALALDGEGLAFLSSRAVLGLFLGGIVVGMAAAGGAVHRFLSRLP
jgi:cell division transport system permease protein